MSEQFLRKYLINGEMVEGTPVTLSPTNEPWVEYLASDGTVLRIKSVVLEAVRLKDRYESDGTPQYYIKNNMVMHVSPAESLRKPI